MLPYYFQIPLGAILAIVDPVVIAVSKLKVVLQSLLESQLCWSLELRYLYLWFENYSEIVFVCITGIVVELFDLYTPLFAEYRITCNAMKVVFVEYFGK